MTETDSKKMPDFKRLQNLHNGALAAGFAFFILTMRLSGQFQNPELVPIIIIFALASITYSGTFYFGCLFFEGSLQKYIISDDTVIKGQTVEMVTTTEDSGDEIINKWIGRYAFARNMFGMSIIPLLLLGGLYFFG